MSQSEKINELATALSKAQGKISAAHADSENPFFQSKYADLASVWDACRTPLSDNGLCVVQTMKPTEQGVTVITTLLHSSGQWISGELNMMPNKSDPQGIGSCITYNRRYSLSAIVGISPEEDDGNEASKGKAPKKTTPSKATPKAEPTSQSTALPGLTVIKNVESVDGGTEANPWTKYTITDGNNKKHTTFDSEHERIAKIAMEKRAEVLIELVKEGQYWNIKTIEMIDPQTGEASGNLSDSPPVLDEDGKPI